MEDFILEGPSVPREICDGVIDFYNTCQYFDKSPGMVANSMSGDLQVFTDVKESIDMHCNLSAKDSRMSEYFYSLANSLDAYYSKYYYASEPASIYPDYNIQWYPPGGGFKQWHYESGSSPKLRRRHLTWQTFLSDNPNGGTEFLYQKKCIPAEKGKTIVWPAGWTHTHRGVVDPDNEKMIITGWITFDG